MNNLFFVCAVLVLSFSSAFADQISSLVDNSSDVVRNLQQMDQMKLRSGEVEKTPWSDYNWPLYKGSIANRYADDSFPSSENWKDNYDFGIANPATYLFQIKNKQKIADLSPVEKYDYWTGNNARYLSLTAEMWNALDMHYQMTDGAVNKSLGLSWAAASVMLDQPLHSVTVKAPDGITEIEFFPSDIKALASLLWTKAPYLTREIKDPNLSADIFHMAIVNQIGVSKRSLIVMNQPVKSYSYKYFKPEGVNDSSVVGVAMELTYVVSTSPSHNNESTRVTTTKTVTHRYLLKQDADKNIVSGEWYQNRHPDYLWVPDKYANAESFLEKNLENLSFSKDTALPLSFTDAAKKTSEYSTPIGLLVKGLIEWSRN